MAYTTINKHTDYFNTVTFTGNNSTQNITGVGFQPDWVWLKKRNGTANHHVVDAVRGVGYYLYPNLTNAQGGNGSSLLTAFGADGFTLDNGADSNGSGAEGVSWNWKANGQGSANTEGSINTTYTSVNTTAGFSIIKYTGSGSVGTIGHGLGAKPNVIFQKKLDSSAAWTVYHDKVSDNPAEKYLYLNSTAALGDYADHWNDTEPTSSLITLGTDTSVNGSGVANIIYAFTEKTGYSKFGSYRGNGSADGAFVYTGFRPQWILIKPISGTANWQIHDTHRDGYNVKNDNLAPNNDAAEADNQFMDILSNGFKLRSATYSASSTTYIYMAFGQSLVGSNQVPCTAR